MEKFHIPLEAMIQYLCYCRFEMVDLGMEESKPVQNVINWFFALLERTGAYPRPQGYKSFRERQVDEKQRHLDESQQKIEQLKALARKEQEQAREKAFWTMMADPESEQYRRCFERLNGFMQKRARKGGLAFEDAMRKQFEEEWEKD